MARFAAGIGEIHQVSVSADYTVLASDDIVAVDTSGGAVTITLPSSQANKGRALIVKDSGGAANANDITVATEGSETIDGEATDLIATAYGRAGYFSDGTNWFTV